MDTVIIACSTLRPELELVMKRTGCLLPVKWVDSGLHTHPEKLRACLQDTLDSLPEDYKTVLLLFGFCGNSLVGVEAKKRTLVLPIVSDCIPLFMGSPENRDKAGKDAYFLTEGYMGEDNIIEQHDKLLERYDEEDAVYITKTMMAHYKRLAIINTGAFALEPMVERVRPYAESLDLTVDVVEGNLCLIEDLLKQDWPDGRFLTVPPGKTITLKDSLRAGESLQVQSAAN